MERAVIVAITGLVLCASAAPAAAQTLRGSQYAMREQNRIAREHDFTFLRTGAQVRRFVEAGYLVHLPGNANYELASVSHPYARPAVRLFVERLSAQYRAACGEKLVVTSLTRPLSEQPHNASALSVHPAGMAVDLRVSGRAACRRWLERTLLSLERQGVLNANRENRPPHYHVAVYPTQYKRYVANITGQSLARVAAAASSSARRSSSVSSAASSRASRSSGSSGSSGSRATPGAATVAAALADLPEATDRYRVNRGDTLWSIARRHGTTVEVLKALNGLRDYAIVAGQTLQVPSTASVDMEP
jgi:LysM repeat protein